MSIKTIQFVTIETLKRVIDRKLINCEHLELCLPDADYPYIKCNRDSKAIEIWDCISCLKIGLEDKFTYEQLYKGPTLPIIESQETLPNGVTVSHVRLLTEVCPMGYNCEDCKDAGPKLHYDTYCEIHKVWVSQ